MIFSRCAHFRKCFEAKAWRKGGRSDRFGSKLFEPDGSQSRRPQRGASDEFLDFLIQRIIRFDELEEVGGSFGKLRTSFRHAFAWKKFAPTTKRKTGKGLKRNSTSFFFRFGLIFIDI
ncbi:MAG: hypothetical protein A3C80_02225 [Candidatus Ryanbacteria bacterium RIFCSPHIGHO2_02_FULL_45_43]|uniref:Uncharacterized protein n=1 Tax=Candidatus Ryanbacteria bacterium RIFCSPHIGHO2_01_45_13 TaxID=1802112 RepID=A0A1G2FWI2_9BACT|nr:MAG: hypothetical protein A2718_00655 [Candidatus Ryanbacteria bacterium RIFCSPHIGHO2_01_FULL_44_130]OGZ42423.1 MAG: hypothetical protein A2W41_03500 [Candidatus Ryanbacteria bacterium RIFCSPHIGHO2_01_45_13]OGZ48440.1 MAG: hypothetical protein A3C80_02225 [Candidatus Ryanbacteria bacterium RIFCSPHIGHO2_02_FULL_45_43]OGZ50305.1 MAG: hypothetical protein A3E55_00125 [Candidatus Ryanbacteria bacterium RIFCSPHIGHO2_12_FULL_44_20]OGZ51644.1 MAG: hypothetical protein A3A17_02575 [Candidatus Ryanba